MSNETQGKSPETKKVEFRLEEERVLERITVKDFADIEQGKFDAVLRVFSQFVWSHADDDYLPEEEGLEVVGSLPMGQLNAILEDFDAQVKKMAIDPKPKTTYDWESK